MNIIHFIESWPSNLDQAKVVKFVNLKNALMIYIPVLKEKNKDTTSKEHFYCSLCQKWLNISGSIKNITRHAAIHVPEFFKACNDDNDKSLLTKKQEDTIIKNIIGFIIFETNTFSLIESPFLHNIVKNIPSKNKFLLAMKNLSNATQREISNQILFSMFSCLAFDEWTDMRNRPFLGINIRSLINGTFRDFFLDFIYLSEEVNDAPVLAAKIRQSLKSYRLNINDILSCSTDNCSLMNKTCLELQVWRIPCVLHLLNLIFHEFIKAIIGKISQIMDLIKYISNSEYYENFIFRKSQQGIKIKKVPSYCETRWTSFCESIIVLYDTFNHVKEFIEKRQVLDSKQYDLLQRLNLLCSKYKSIILKYEKDEFGASGFFLADISIIKKLFSDVENTDLRQGSLNAKKKLMNYRKIILYFSILLRQWH